MAGVTTPVGTARPDAEAKQDVDIDVDLEAWLDHELEKPCEAHVGFRAGLGPFIRTWQRPCGRPAVFAMRLAPTKGCASKGGLIYVCERCKRIADRDRAFCSQQRGCTGEHRYVVTFIDRIR